MGAGASSVKPLQTATNPNLNGQNPNLVKLTVENFYFSLVLKGKFPSGRLEKFHQKQNVVLRLKFCKNSPHKIIITRQQPM
jgi:hypothetical protein